MAIHEIVLPKMGEGIIEATINKWLKEVGETVGEDDAIVEVATDKVDSEVPSPVEGVLKKVLFNEGDVAQVGDIIAIIETEGVNSDEETETVTATISNDIEKIKISEEIKSEEKTTEKDNIFNSDIYFSPLVKSIAKEEGISVNELEKIKGSGKDGRLTKRDLLAYLENRNQESGIRSQEPVTSNPGNPFNPPKGETQRTDYDYRHPETSNQQPVTSNQQPIITTSAGDEVFEMDRMRKLIADHMVMSTHVSPHVTSFIDVDVSNIVVWRNKIKEEILKREGEKITFTPIFINAVAQALMEFPQVNASLDGYNVILRKKINIGMAAALPNGNLIVPVIKNADQKNLLGTAKIVNDLAKRSRENKLQPDDIQGGTFTLTNFGSFDSLTGTPIINQPQVAILGVGAIRKKPVVIETESGDMIGIRHIMILSMAYDHRIVDGALGGMFLRRLKQLLENFDVNTVI